MHKWGKTFLGKQRFRCSQCHITAIRSRTDIGRKADYELFVRWLTSGRHLEDIARETRLSVRSLWSHFQPFWPVQPLPKTIQYSPQILVVDGVSVVKRNLMTLIAQDPFARQPVGWIFTPRESYSSWCIFFNELKKQGVYPAFLVCDGQRGLLKAIHEVWPDTVIQRCLIHIIRQARTWLTQKPKTRAGCELLILVRLLTTVTTEAQEIIWTKAYEEWRQKHTSFLKEKTRHPAHNKKWWYTHRRMRAVRSLLTNSLPYIFTFIDHPQVPKTSNHVEGGINSRIKDLLRIHRGLRPHHQQIMIAWFLATKQGQKPTQNFH